MSSGETASVAETSAGDADPGTQVMIIEVRYINAPPAAPTAVSTDITITRSGEVVSWESSRDKPMDRSVHFSAADYDGVVKPGVQQRADALKAFLKD